MTRPETTAYAWRDDFAVPDFDDRRLLVVMDGECALCSATARRIARLDRADAVRITTVQAPLGAALLRHSRLDPENPESWLLVADGQVYTGLDAVLRLFPRLNRAFLPLKALRLLPHRAQAWIYARIARNRYDLFGKADICALPDPELRRRLLV